MKLTRAFLIVSMLWSLTAVGATPVSIQNLRMWRAPDNTRLVFDLSGVAEYHVSALEGPDRVLVDFDKASFKGAVPEVEASNTLVTAVRDSRVDNDTVRFVFELKRAVKTRSFVLKPAGQYGHRLVVDLMDPQAEAEEAKAAAEETAPPPPVAPTSRVVMPKRREWVIAIDAGHGGEDPGAIGRQYRTREKDVTLAIALALARLVRDEPGMRPVLIRDGDYYVPLGRRFQRARQHRADVFVSIHADSMPGKKIAYGSSVYALSERGATHALARALADNENYADLVGGVSLNDKTSDVKRTLLDLSQEKTIEHSLQLGEDVLSELGQIGKIHSGRVAQANFAVLKSPDIPSVLVETAFISTPTEEKKLRDAQYQSQLASAVLKGLKRYLVRNSRFEMAPPAPEAPTARVHIVKNGETLNSIAKQYNVHIEVLRFINNLSDNRVSPGLRLRLPGAERES